MNEEELIPTEPIEEEHAQAEPEIPEFYNKHFIRVRSDGCIIDGWSNGPHNYRVPTEDDILINDKGGYQFRLIVDGEPTEENPPLYDFAYMIPLYRWTGSEVVLRAGEEIEAEQAEKRARAEAAEQERVANATETVLLEMAADHEERICMIELGISDDL